MTVKAYHFGWCAFIVDDKKLGFGYWTMRQEYSMINKNTYRKRAKVCNI